MIISYREAFIGRRDIRDYNQSSEWMIANDGEDWTPEFMEIKKFTSNGQGLVDAHNWSYLNGDMIITRTNDGGTLHPSSEFVLYYLQSQDKYFCPLKNVVSRLNLTDGDIEKILDFLKTKNYATDSIKVSDVL